MKKFSLLLCLLVILLTGCSSEASFEYVYDTFYTTTSSGVKAGNKEDLVPKTTHEKICLSLVASDNVNEVVEIPSKVKTNYDVDGEVVVVGAGAFIELDFEKREKLVEVILPESIKIIDAYAFAGRTNLSKINLDNVLIIKEGAFSSYIYFIESKNDETSKLWYGPYAINGHKIKNLNLSSAIVIEDYAFASGIDYENIIFGENLEYIGDYAFFDGIYNKELYLPKSLKYIGTEALGLKKSSSIRYAGTIEEFKNIEKGENWYRSCTDRPMYPYFDIEIKCLDGSIKASEL